MTNVPTTGFEVSESVILNAAIDSSISAMVNALKGKDSYQDYIYKKSTLDQILFMLGKHKVEVKVEEVLDDNGEFFCWRIRNMSRKYKERSDFFNVPSKK